MVRIYGLIIGMLWLVACTPPAAREHDYLLATASTGGTFYPVGVAMATLWTETLQDSPAVRVAAMNSAGSGENIQLLRFEEADFAILQGLFGAMAVEGTGKYEGRPQGDAFLAVCNLWSNVEHFVIEKDLAQSGTLADLEQLQGKRFSIGKRGSGTETSGRVILEALGYEPEEDFSLEYLGYSSSASALQDGRIDGMNIPAGVPVAAITQAYATMGSDEVTVLNVTSDQLAQINAAYPLWRPFAIPPQTYPGQTDTIFTISQPNFLAVRPGVPEDDVYRLTKALFEHLSELYKAHRAATQITPENALLNLPCELHPGAERYYQEMGWLGDAGY